MDEYDERKYISEKKYVEDQTEHHYSNNKFFLLNKDKCQDRECNRDIYADDQHKCNGCFSFFQDLEYKYFANLQRKFNYYLLIERRHYKIFKESRPYIGHLIFPDITKFIKKSYNKKIFKLNNKEYIKLKLREFNNTFTTHLYLSVCVYIYNIYDYIEMIAVPVKNPYTNLMVKYEMDYDDITQKYIDGKLYCEKYKISNNRTLYITPEIGNQNYEYKIDKKDLSILFKKTIDDFEDYYLNNIKKIIDLSWKQQRIYEEIFFIAFIHNIKDDYDYCTFYCIKGYIKKSLIQIISE